MFVADELVVEILGQDLMHLFFKNIFLAILLLLSIISLEEVLSKELTCLQKE